jgi:anti-sigma B factor antagonist
MAQADISMNVRRPNSAVGIIDITGQVTAATETALMEAYSQASDNGARAIILNFTGLDYMNSSGIGLLVTLLIRAQRQKQQLLAYGLNEHYRQIFDLTRLDEAIALYDSETGALAAA